MQVAIVLPPREGFGPEAVGAIGLLVHRLAAADDVVVGQAGTRPVFAGRRFVAAAEPWWPPAGRVGRYMAGVVKTLRRLRPDVVEVHNRANLALAVRRALPEARVALFLHNDPLGMRGAKRAGERAALLRTTRVVCVSDYLAGRFLEGVAAGGARPAVLPNALALGELPARLGVGVRERTILFVGRVVADKGADAFVRACGAVLPVLPGWRAVMIGADRFWAGSEVTAFERALAPAAAAAGVERSGYLPHGAVLAAMARAAIVVVPSRWAEPFGLTALEAMASGAALICSALGGLPEVAGEAAIYAEADEVGALEAAMLRVAQDAGLRERMVEAGLRRAGLFEARVARERLAALRAGY